MSWRRFVVIGGVCLWLSNQPLSAQALTYERSLIAEGIYLFHGPDAGAGNAVAIISEGEALIVDATASPRSATDIIDGLVVLGVQRLRGVVNTHWHQDHIWGNQAFLGRFPAAPIISHHRTLQDIRELAIPDLDVQIAGIHARLDERDRQLRLGKTAAGEDMTSEEREALSQRQALFRELVGGLEEVDPTLPDITFEESLTIQVGALRIVLTHLGPAHSFGDIVVHVPERDVLIAGDLVTRPFPAAGDGFSSIVGWGSALDALTAMDFDVLIPGHGDPVVDREYLDDVHDLVRSVLAQTRAGIEEGRDAESITADIDVSAFADAHVSDEGSQRAAFQAFFVAPAVSIAYRELTP